MEKYFKRLAIVLVGLSFTSCFCVDKAPEGGVKEVDVLRRYYEEKVEAKEAVKRAELENEEAIIAESEVRSFYGGKVGSKSLSPDLYNKVQELKKVFIDLLVKPKGVLESIVIRDFNLVKRKVDELDAIFKKRGIGKAGLELADEIIPTEEELDGTGLTPEEVAARKAARLAKFEETEKQTMELHQQVAVDQQKIEAEQQKAEEQAETARLQNVEQQKIEREKQAEVGQPTELGLSELLGEAAPAEPVAPVAEVVAPVEVPAPVEPVVETIVPEPAEVATPVAPVVELGPGATPEVLPE